MKRRKFLKKTGLAAAGTILAPYILPSGRLFAATGQRVVNHVVFVLFAGGIRNQESVNQLYLEGQGIASSGNLMENMLAGAPPNSNLLYNRWQPILSTPLSQQGALFQELYYAEGPTGHYNGHTCAMTGNYSESGINVGTHPAFPTIFEYYRKHADPTHSAINAWWISEGLGPYPSLNYSGHPGYGAMYGANYLQPYSMFGRYGPDYLQNTQINQLDDINKLESMREFLNKNFDKTADAIPGIQNTKTDRQSIKEFLVETIQDTVNGNIEWPLPPGSQPWEATGDLIDIGYSWKVLERFKPELTVINTFNVDTCHGDYSNYLQFLHYSDYGVGWLWNKIQSDPVLANDTIMICMPEHGRNLEVNTVADENGLFGIDHTSDDNSRRNFALVVGPPSVMNQGSVYGAPGSSVGENIDIVPTIAHILGFHEDIPASLLPGRILTEAFS